MPMSDTVATDPAMTTGTVEVTMPPTGSELPVTVSAWLKHPGDRVSEEEAICVVGWGDATAEIASPASGVMRMVTLAAGDDVTIGATLAVVDLRVGSLASGRFVPGEDQG
jgi:pyruvate/2-oxoglutarate dehydrogenase complex dihydrolipoamide acyltransferase (E2) component